MFSSVILFHISPPFSWALLSTPFKGFGNASSCINSAFSSQDSATAPLLGFKVFVVCCPPGFMNLNTWQPWSPKAECKNLRHIIVFVCWFSLGRLLRCCCTCRCDASPLFVDFVYRSQNFSIVCGLLCPPPLTSRANFHLFAVPIEMINKFLCTHSASFCNSFLLLSSFRIALPPLFSFDWFCPFSKFCFSSFCLSPSISHRMTFLDTLTPFSASHHRWADTIAWSKVVGKSVHMSFWLAIKAFVMKKSISDSKVLTFLKFIWVATPYVTSVESYSSIRFLKKPAPPVGWYCGSHLSLWAFQSPPKRILACPIISFHLA